MNYVDYKFRNVKDDGKSSIVEYRVYLGEYVLLPDLETGKDILTYTRTQILGTGTVLFDSSIDLNEVRKKLNSGLDDFSKISQYTVIEEQLSDGITQSTALNITI